MKPSASSTVDLKVNFSRHTTATSPHSPQLTAAVVDTRRLRILRSLLSQIVWLQENCFYRHIIDVIIDI